jgi:hypothetical protein
MRIGLDFDNTIACYEQVFYSVALEMGLIPDTVDKTKLAVRTYFRETGQEDTWTELQGLVYGNRMDATPPYPAVLKTLRWFADHDLDICIISHKTKHPYQGPKFDLHASASNWINSTLRDSTGLPVSHDKVYFLETNAEKITKIAKMECDVYIDDLPEILLDSNFPSSTQRILFDPGYAHKTKALNSSISYCARSWQDIQKHIQSLIAVS